MVDPVSRTSVGLAVRAEAVRRSDPAAAPAAPQAQPGRSGTPANDAAATAPAYISPVITIDRQALTAVLQFRDAATGAVERQYPSEKQLQAYSAQSRQVESPAAPKPEPREAEPKPSSSSSSTSSSVPAREAKPEVESAPRPDPAGAAPRGTVAAETGESQGVSILT